MDATGSGLLRDAQPNGHVLPFLERESTLGIDDLQKTCNIFLHKKAWFQVSDAAVADANKWLALLQAASAEKQNKLVVESGGYATAATFQSKCNDSSSGESNKDACDFVGLLKHFVSSGYMYLRTECTQDKCLRMFFLVGAPQRRVSPICRHSFAGGERSARENDKWSERVGGRPPRGKRGEWNGTTATGSSLWWSSAALPIILSCIWTRWKWRGKKVVMLKSSPHTQQSCPLFGNSNYFLNLILQYFLVQLQASSIAAPSGIEHRAQLAGDTAKLCRNDGLACPHRTVWWQVNELWWLLSIVDCFQRYHLWFKEYHFRSITTTGLFSIKGFSVSSKTPSSSQSTTKCWRMCWVGRGPMQWRLIWKWTRRKKQSRSSTRCRWAVAIAQNLFSI